MTFTGVDPAALQTAAGRAALAGEAAQRSHDLLARCAGDLHRWCPPELARQVDLVFELLQIAATDARLASAQTADRLQAAAARYAAADRQLPR